jgi:hypothetical protein
MTMKNEQDKDGAPAFPTKREALDPRAAGWFAQEGMTLRDWFAGQALTGTVLSPLGQGGRLTYESTARDAYCYADAMLAARVGGAK